MPFLPLLAKQILLNNFLSDIPAIGLPGDAVAPELVARPHQWDLRGIRNFMIVFGLVSSLFDYATFGPGDQNAPGILEKPAGQAAAGA